MSAALEMPAGLRRAYLLALAPPAFLAPVPLLWTSGASAVGVLLYEVSLLFLWTRARAGSPIRLSATFLNVAGLLYFFWLGFEASFLRHGLLKTVSHLLLFTALAKLASLKQPGEARMAQLVLFLVMLASCSSSTHVSSLIYFAAMAILTFRALGRLAVLADFDDAPPERVLSAVPTPGLAAAALLGAGALAAPLFYVLPRLQNPYAVAPFRVDDAFAATLSADRVDLESFGAAKRSDAIILRMSVEPPAFRDRFARLRESVFTRYSRGGWTRHSSSGVAIAPFPGLRAGEMRLARASIDLNLFQPGYLFLPYAAMDVDLERGRGLASLPDGVLQATSRRSTVRYGVSVRSGEARGQGESAIDPASVPEEVRAYAWKLTGDINDPHAIAERIAAHMARDFVYTLDAPRPRGDPLAHFLLRSKAGHCEYFASAAAMMLAARGIRARLVTGSYGGEVGMFSQAVVVRGGNLHAWVEADLDGKGFSVFDPTPPSGIPAAAARVSWIKRLATLGRELEFFYDRRILGFDSLDQGQLLDSARQSLGDAAGKFSSWKLSTKESVSRVAPWVAVTLLATLLAALLGKRLSGRPRLPAATRAYLSLRRLLARRLGKAALSPAVPPAEVARLFGETAPEGGDDALAVVQTYCASTFGGIRTGPEAERALSERLHRLRKLA